MADPNLPKPAISSFFVGRTENVTTTSAVVAPAISKPMFTFGGTSSSVFFKPSPFSLTTSSQPVSEPVKPPVPSFQNLFLKAAPVPSSQSQFFESHAPSHVAQSSKPFEIKQTQFFVPQAAEEPKLLFSVKSSPQSIPKPVEDVPRNPESSERELSLQLNDDDDDIKRKESLSRSIAKKNQDLEKSTRKKLIEARLTKLIPKITSIICKNLPQALISKEFLMQHFSKFGEVKKISCSLRNSHAIIHYTDHDSAELAKSNGTKISSKYDPVPIFWFQKTHKKERRSVSSVDEELDSMLHGAGEHELLERPKESKPKSKESKSDIMRRVKPIMKRENQQEKQNLLGMLVQCGNTAEERFRILEARDKLMRLDFEKQSALCGMCTDMCPETERYRRFYENSLSIFEVPEKSNKSKSLEHKMIIKEYSRSSADQAEPLPHDVRPSKILQMTMDYMLCNIMDNPDDLPVGEWYDFIWDRTRSIHKDITQQRIRDVIAAEIIEKCARFHILCSYTLCEEDIAIFDPKINDENLRKCLQTLEHMYQDLAKNGIHCTNEAEFKAYGILLYLNESNVLNHVENFTSDLRNSTEIKFAMACANAVASNTYVAFFNLVEKTTYLNACILQRYFSKVRVQAMDIMLNAYCRQNRKDEYPIENVIRILKFENHEEAANFFEMVGLGTQDGSVVLDKTAFVRPVCTPSSSVYLVDSKKRGNLVAEVINKDPLPINPLTCYQPCNSFDSKGYLKREIVQSLDIETDLQISKTRSSKPTSSTDSIKKRVPRYLPSVEIEDRDIEVVSENIEEPFMEDPQVIHEPERNVVHEVIDIDEPDSDAIPKVIDRDMPETVAVPEVIDIDEQDMDTMPEVIDTDEPEIIDIKVANKESFKTDAWTTLLAQHGFSSFKNEVEDEPLHFIASAENFPEIVGEPLCEVLPEISDEIIEETLAPPPMQDYQDKKDISLDEQELDAFSTDFLHSVVESEISELVKKERAFEDSCAELSNGVLSEVINSVLSELFNEIQDEIQIEVLEALLAEKTKELEAMNLETARKVIIKWREFCKTRKKMKDLASFLKGPILFKRKDAASITNPIAALSEKNRATKLLNASIMNSALKDEMAWLPFDLRDTFESCMREGIQLPLLSPKTHYWKLLLLHVNEEKNSESTFLMNWLHSKFSKGKAVSQNGSKSKLCSLYWLANPISHRIAICVRSIAIGIEDFSSSLEKLKENSELEGTCGILLCLSSHHREMEKKWQTQLVDMLKSKAPIPKVPLHCLIISPDAGDCVQIESLFNEKDFSDLFSSHRISHLRTKQHLYLSSAHVLNEVRQLITNCPTISQLAAKSLKYYILDAIVDIFHFIRREKMRVKEQNSYSQFWQPNLVISFFNCVMSQRASLVSSQELKRFSWPLPEIIVDQTVKCSPTWNHDSNLSKIKNILEPVNLPIFEGNPSLVDHVMRYVENLIVTSDNNSWHLKNRCFYYLNKFGNSVGDKEMPWIEIIYECAQYIALRQISKNCIADDEEVHYCEDEYENYDLLQTWTKVMKESYLQDYSTCNGEVSSESENDLQSSAEFHENLVVDVNYCEPSQDGKRKNGIDSASFLSKKRKSDFALQLDEALATECYKSNSFLSLLEKSSLDDSLPVQNGTGLGSRTNSRRKVRNRKSSQSQLQSSLLSEIKESEKLIKLLKENASCDPLFGQELYQSPDVGLWTNIMDKIAFEDSSMTSLYRPSDLPLSNGQFSDCAESLKHLKEQIISQKQADANFASILETLSYN